MEESEAGGQALGLCVAPTVKDCPFHEVEVDLGPTDPEEGDAALPAVAKATTIAAAAMPAKS